MVTHNIAKTEKVEMYLKAIMMIGWDAPPVTITKISQFLGVSAPSASEMIKRLEKNRLVDASSDDGIHLTSEGEIQGQRVIRRMRLAERLLSDIILMPLEKVYDEACKLEHVMSTEMEERLAAVLGEPETCPHGHPIPANGGKTLSYPDRTLADLKSGDAAVISSLPEEDADLVKYLTGLGIVPDARIKVDEVAPFNGPLFLRVGGERQGVGLEAAARVRVRTSG